MTSPAPPGWPQGVEQIEFEDLKRLGINTADELFWDGRRIEVKRRLDLTRLEKAFALVVTIMAVLGGLGGFVSGFNAASEFLCARSLHWLSCPLQQSPLPPVMPPAPHAPINPGKASPG